MSNSIGKFSVQIPNIKTIQLFLTGFMVIIHTIMLFPYELYMLIIGLMMIAWMITISDGNKFRVNKNLKRYFLWYGLFTALVISSLLYTVNTINPDYVIKRVLVIFVLGAFTATYLSTEEDFNILADGIISGEVVLIIATWIIEGANWGYGRIGLYTVGSAVALSGLLLVGYICTVWKIMGKKNHKYIYISLAISFVSVIMLSGSRRALIISLLIPVLFILIDSTIRKSKKIIFLLEIIAFLLIVLYLAFYNDTLYSIIGIRLESMMQAFFGNAADFTDASMIERTDMKEYAYYLFLNRPILGYGVHGFAFMFNNYYGKLLYSHNGFTEILSCYGIVGFVVFYREFFKIMLHIRKCMSRGTFLQKILCLYVILTLMLEPVSISFICAQVIIMVIAASNLIMKGEDTWRNLNHS